jgi:hypothetical protein
MERLRSTLSAREQNGTALFLILLCLASLLSTSRVNAADQRQPHELADFWTLQNINGKSTKDWDRDLFLTFDEHNGYVSLEIAWSYYDNRRNRGFTYSSYWAGTWKSSRHSQIELSRLTNTKNDRNCPAPGLLLDNFIQHWAEIRSYRVSNGGTELVLVLSSNGSKWQFANGKIPPNTLIETFNPNGRIEKVKP